MKPFCLALLLASALPAQAEENFGKETTATAKAIVAVLASACQAKEQFDENAAAWEACRDALLKPDFAKLFATAIPWGALEPGVPIWEKKLKALDSAALRGEYLPMFAFSGGSAMAHEANGSMVVLKVHARFRKFMPVTAHKNAPYELAKDNWKLNELVFRIDPATALVWTVMYAEDAEAPVKP